MQDVNDKSQYDAQFIKIKSEAKMMAIQVAQRTMPVISGEGFPKFDIIKEAEKIYQWLIDIK